MLIKTLALSLLAAAAGATAAQAQQTAVLNNLSTSPISGSSDGVMVAEAFMTGGSATVLADVMFPQVLQGPSPSTYFYNYSSSETLTLFTNNPTTGLPLSVLLTLSGSSLSFGAGSNTTAGPITGGTFGQTTASVPTDAASQLAATLLPNTKYWLELGSGSTTAAVSWDYSNSTAFNAAAGFSLPATGFASEVAKANGSISNYTLANGPQLLYIDVNAVPEPSTYCLMAVAGLALVVSRKRARKLA